ncbi:MAG: alpha-1,4-glucan--maltose-1-phosphate maltosyltransferase [Chitinophagales bacterium]|nr:alpha-1,4-glucan--maltose-1-phosphate maltosyltransferase [Chitinophagales bacterium]
MKGISGKSRAIIEHVKPAIDNGEFPIKRVEGERVEVTADIYCDGHDKIKAVLLYKHIKQRKWNEVPMHLISNDRWGAYFKTTQTGWYEYTIQAWVDHFATWQHDIKRKFEAGQHIATELLMGANMILEVAEKSSTKLTQKLIGWAQQMQSPIDFQSEVNIALSPELSEQMYRYGHRSNATMYPKLLKVQVERQKALFSTWYELFPRSTAKEKGQHGTFADVAHLLPRISALGFDVLYLPPVHPIGTKFRKGKNNNVKAAPDEPGSPWAIGNKEGGHKAIHPQLGSLDDFRALIAKAQEYNMEIAMDIAFQCSPDHPYVTEHPEWFKWRPDGTVQYAENPPKKYQDIIPINFETDDWQNLWRELKSVVDYWILEGVKIFRVDNPHTKAFAFWQWMIAEVKKDAPEVLFLSEAFTRPRIMERLAKIGFSQSYTYFTWRNTGEEIKEYLIELTSTEVVEYMRPNFWPNTPDILPVSLENKDEPAFITRLLLAATLSSNYGIYGPVFELGLNEAYSGKEEYNQSEKYEIHHWDWSKETKITDAIRKVNLLRKGYKALQQTRNLMFLNADNAQLLAFIKYDDDKTELILTVINLDTNNQQAGWIQVPLYLFHLPYGEAYTVHDLMTGNKYTWKDEWNYVMLHPNIAPAHMFHLEVNPIHNPKQPLVVNVVE